MLVSTDSRQLRLQYEHVTFKEYKALYEMLHNAVVKHHKRSQNGIQMAVFAIDSDGAMTTNLSDARYLFIQNHQIIKISNLGFMIHLVIEKDENDG